MVPDGDVYLPKSASVINSELQMKKGWVAVELPKLEKKSEFHP